MKNKLIALLTVLITACEANQKEVSLPAAQTQTLAPQQLIITIEDLNETTTQEQWAQFFQERGAALVWQALKQKSAEVTVDFDKLEQPSIPMAEKASQIAAGVIQYLSHHNSGIQRLSLKGGTHTKMGFLPPAIDRLKNLKELDLSCNKLTALPFSIGNLTQLQVLNLSCNELAQLPSSIGHLNALKYLILPVNRLEKLPVEIGLLKNLGWLVVEYNYLKELPSTIKQLSHLEGLLFQYNDLTALPASLDDFVSQKTTISFGGNRRHGKSLVVYSEKVAIENQVHIEKMTKEELSAYAHQKASPSLFNICCGYVKNNLVAPANQEQQKKILEKMPTDVRTRLNEHIIYFKPRGLLELTFYWDQELRTNQDAANMLETLKDKDVYLLVPNQ